MLPRQALIALTIVVPLFAASQGSAQTQPATQTSPIEDGSLVHLEYTLTDDGRKLIESNKGKDPLVYTQGRGQIIHGLEKALLGMHEGETKHVTVPPEEAYGAKDPQAIIELPKERVPPDVVVGAQLTGRNQNGQPIRALVKEIKEISVVLDFNHPLAGKTLIFDITVLSVTPAKTN